MGMSALMFWDGRAASEKRMQELSDHCGLQVSAGSFACEAALNLTKSKRIAVISPYFPISDKNVSLFFQDCGFDVVRFRGLKCPSHVAIAQVQSDELRAQIAEMDGDDVDAFVQVGTNLPMCALCVDLEKEYGKPFVAINAATYWRALQAMGINDQFAGHGPLFEGHCQNRETDHEQRLSYRHSRNADRCRRGRRGAGRGAWVHCPRRDQSGGAHAGRRDI